jgi:hypothetical protein
MTAPSTVSPNVGNYRIGRGNVYTKLANPVVDSVYVHAGNCPVFQFDPKPTILPHYSSMVSGARIKDFSAVVQLDATLTLELEEYTPRNLGFAFLSLPQDTAGSITLPIMADSDIQAAIKLIDSSTIGADYTYEFLLCRITSSKAMDLINSTNAWGNMSLTCDVLNAAAPGSTTPLFGYVTGTVAGSPVN